MDLWILYEIMCIWTMVRMSMVCKPRGLIGFHPNLGFLEIRGDKTLDGIKSIKSSPFDVGFMVQWKEIELGFRTNPNTSWCLVCVWVKTHIRVVWEYS